MALRRFLLGTLLTVPAAAFAHGSNGHCGRRGGPGHPLPNGRCEATFPAARELKDSQQASFGESAKKSKQDSRAGNERTPIDAPRPKNSTRIR
jgi:hypothetical protein